MTTSIITLASVVISFVLIDIIVDVIILKGLGFSVKNLLRSAWIRFKNRSVPVARN